MDNNVEHIGTHIIQNQIETLPNVYSFVMKMLEEKQKKSLLQKNEQKQENKKDKRKRKK